MLTAWQAMGDMSSASEALKRALALSHESCDRHGEAKCLIAFGELYRDIWATRRASEHIERALSISIELQVLSSLALLVLDKGRASTLSARSLSVLSSTYSVYLL
jgi:tetratricopeptide (TPR) repeat protein